MTQAILDAIESAALIRRTGHIKQFYSLAAESYGPDVFVGEICEVMSPQGTESIRAEAVGFKNGNVLLMPCGSGSGLKVGSRVVATGRPAKVAVGSALIGRVLDGLGEPIDGKGPVEFEQEYVVNPEPVNPLYREKISEQLHTGIKLIDGFLPIGKGQRMGIFAGSGVGKSTLLGQVMGSLDVDINVVALIGERGREALEFIEEVLGERALENTVVIVAGADQPALVRTHAAYTAFAVAEYFRDQGKDVLLAMDSITRFAMAQREIGLAIGEPPTFRGYTPSVFSKIPGLLERAGNFKGKGSITGLFSVLVEGDDLNEPISDHVRSILDGHIVLSRELANSSVFPAIDLQHSNSRLDRDLLTEDQLVKLSEANSLLATYEDAKDLLMIGNYQSGQNLRLDAAIKFYEAFSDFRTQRNREENAKDALFQFLVKELSNDKQ